MDLGIAGWRAVVAGASAGLGFGVAQALVGEGVQVAICGRDTDRLEQAAARLGAGTVAIPADVSTLDGARAFVTEASARLGPLDILVPNAGGPPAGAFADTPSERYVDAFVLNCVSVVAMCEAAIPAMRAQQWGRVVVITSIAVRQPKPALILSNTARAGVTGFLRTVAREVAGDGVTVNSLQPGFHDTDRLRSLGADLDGVGASIPARRLGEPADFGAVAAFLCSDHARFVTGTALQIDGGEYEGLL
ncbi:MAG: SDR family oxidoreductase [Acidimicrobiia bacterium]